MYVHIYTCIKLSNLGIQFQSGEVFNLMEGVFVFFLLFFCARKTRNVTLSDLLVFCLVKYTELKIIV